MPKSLPARSTFLFAAFVLLMVVAAGAMLWGRETTKQVERHFGLRVMQARAAHIGEELRVASAPGPGTRVPLLFPVEESAV